MPLRPKRVFNRLNRARLPSGILRRGRVEIVAVFRILRGAHQAWIEGSSPDRLGEASQGFIDLLSDLFLVPRNRLSLGDRPRPHSRDSSGKLRSEVYGTCTSRGTVRIYLRTPARGQPTAFKTFFNTLVHEWVHHYDFAAFGDSVHCAGFYERVNALYRLCLESDSEAAEQGCS